MHRRINLYFTESEVFLASVKVENEYQLFIYDKEKNDFTYWDKMDNQPLGINSLGVYYQIKVPKSSKVNHYIKRFEKLGSFKVVLEEINITPNE